MRTKSKMASPSSAAAGAGVRRKSAEPAYTVDAAAAASTRHDHHLPKKLRLVLLGICLHALLIYSIFDIHFQTPLVHGMEPVQADFDAPAKRLVVIVADGLRQGGGAGWHRLDPALKAFGFNSLIVHPFQAIGFKISTCTPYTSGGQAVRGGGRRRAGWERRRRYAARAVSPRHRDASRALGSEPRAPADRVPARPRRPPRRVLRGAAVQARPRLETTRFQSLIAENNNSAFNLKPCFLRLRLYNEDPSAITKGWQANAVEVGRCRLLGG